LFDLTPGERRGALVLLALIALGTAWDMGRPLPRPTPVAAGNGVPAVDSSAAAPSVPAAGPGAAGGSGAPAGAALDLNAATAGELRQLPGIGPVLAGRIVDWRAEHGRFGTVEELRAVRGIGPKLYARLAGQVRAGPGGGAAAAGTVRNATARGR
jgi:competence protein ComEA